MRGRRWPGPVLATLVVVGTACSGPPLASVGLFEDARALAATPTGTLWAVDVDAVVALREGRVVQRLGGIGTSDDAFLDPVDVDPTNGQTIYVVDRAAGAVLQYTAEGRLVRALSVPDVDPADVLRGGDASRSRSVPVGIAAGRAGALFILDAGRRHVLELDVEGEVVRVLGAGLLLDPVDLALDDAGTLWVADAGAGALQPFDAFGVPGEALAVSLVGRIRSVSAARGRFLVVGADAWALITREPLLFRVEGPETALRGGELVGGAPVLLTPTGLRVPGGVGMD